MDPVGSCFSGEIQPRFGLPFLLEGLSRVGDAPHPYETEGSFGTCRATTQSYSAYFESAQRLDAFHGCFRTRTALVACLAVGLVGHLGCVTLAPLSPSSFYYASALLAFDFTNLLSLSFALRLLLHPLCMSLN